MSAADVLREALRLTDVDPNRKLIGTRAFPFQRNAIDSLPVEAVGRNFVAQPAESDVKIDFGRTGINNVVVIGKLARKTTRPIVIEGSNNVIIVGDAKKFAPRITIIGDQNLIYSGDDATMNEVTIVIKADQRSVIVGRDCMFSIGISVRASDSHAIVDLETETVLNAPESVLFHPHVWVGEGASILKGVTVGRGSVIGAGSIVTASVPDCSLAVGAPARVIRSNISWTRNEAPRIDEIRKMKRLLELVQIDDE